MPSRSCGTNAEDTSGDPVERVLERLEGVKQENGHYRALCPAHDDHDPSLIASRGDDGRVLLKCFAGCPTERVVEALGLETRDLFVRNGPNGHGPSASWQIRDAAGAVQAIHDRYDKPGRKECKWRLPDGTHGLKGRKVASLPLYRSELLTEWDREAPIALTEGEKDADALSGVYTYTLGTVTGASSAPSAEVLEVLRGREVLLWPDADEPGRAHMERIARRLEGIASEVRVYEPEGLPEGGGAADHPAVKERDLNGLLEGWQKAPVLAGDRGDGDGTEGSAFGTFTAVELMGEELPPVRWVVPGILPEGVSFLAGKPKMGKSWMSYGLCLAVASGGVALGTQRVERGEALYLALEDNRRRLRRRLDKLLAGGVVPEGLYMALDWPRANEGGVERIDDFLRGHPDCRLVVIDTLARFKPQSSGRRSQYDEDRDAVDPLAPICRDHRVTVLLVHHLREAESDDPLDMIHGSAGLTGGVDGALVLKRQRGDADAYLHVDGRDIEEPAELALEFDANAATWAIKGDAEDYRRSKLRNAILRVLENSDDEMGPQAVADELDEKYDNVRQRMYQMSRDGEIKTVARGKYRAS